MKYKDHLVCINCYTYNHAPYIMDAMDGFCCQQTNFPFVAAIIDDASTDDEQEIIKEYLARYFDMEQAEKWETEEAQFIYAQHRNNSNCLFAVILLKYNFYQRGKSKDPLISRWMETTKYIAFCEGDDYWIDSQKLQMQVDYMEKHKECGCVHTYYKAFKQTEKVFAEGKFGLDLINEDQLFIYNSIKTLTVCIRKKLLYNFSREFGPYLIQRKWMMGDFPLFIYLLMNSKIHFIPKVTGVYRIVSESATHSNDLNKVLEFWDSSLDCHIFMANYYHKEYLVNKIKAENLGCFISSFHEKGVRPPVLKILKKYKFAALYYYFSFVKKRILD